MNLLKTLAGISSMTLLSRITGLMRESLFAAAYGMTPYTDAFNVAFRIPNLLRRLFAEGAFSQAFVPILAEYKNRNSHEATRDLVDHVTSALVWTTLAVSLLGIIAAPWLLVLVATGLEKQPDAFASSVFMTRLMFPYIAFMAFVAMSSGVLNCWRNFKVPAFSPVLLNVALIGAALIVTASPHWPVETLGHPIYTQAAAVMLGGLLQVGIQLPALARIGMLPRLANPFAGYRDAGVRRILGKMGPAVFAVSATQISLLINTNLASRVGPGAVSALTYADRLMEFPTALLGVALGTILLPSLSKANVDGNAEEYSALLNWGSRLTMLLALPAAVGLALLAEPMVAALFNYGKFGANAIGAAAAPLVTYAVGLIGIIMVKILAPAFYARQDVRTPVRIAVAVLIATQLMNLVFVPLLGVAGLALSISLAACLNAATLFFILRRRGIFVPDHGWAVFFFRVGCALAVMAALSWLAAHYIDWDALRAQRVLRILTLLGVIGALAVAYFAVLFGLGVRARDFKRSAR
ncbi:murein biosynthesis integral membrane protein MurJ [Massilia arenosa]|uniref:Probable lipid II flippase MurJ n=1 Tax=Zemynaea arenosa TaxID=2561931 RepID=A0A4Y9SZ62_9BURK|nr:murein biosynthesis integral membrane protein MurJ [Massilia arenosa]TFW30026.1 murein biosynthesis integral membrane protein MurJ [Massilia arenosa]